MVMRSRTAAVSWLATGVIVALAIGAAGRVAARPAVVQVVLNPSRDTYLGQGVGSAQDASKELQTGWVYTTRGREFRAYLEFPLDPALHPVEGLIGAELWLYPDGPPQSSQIAATFVVRTMSEPFAEGRVAPMWFAADDPTVEVEIDRDIEWKKFNVRDHVLDMLRLPDESCGFEVSGKNQTDNTRWDFLSREGAGPASAGGTQPRLVLYFRDTAFVTPSVTPIDTWAPTASATRTPTVATPATATATASALPTATLEAPSAEPVLLPRVLRRD